MRPKNENCQSCGERDDSGEEFTTPIALAIILSNVAHVSCSTKMQRDCQNNGNCSADHRDWIRQPVRHAMLDGRQARGSCPGKMRAFFNSILNLYTYNYPESRSVVPTLRTPRRVGQPTFLCGSKGGNLERFRHEMFSLSASSIPYFLNLY